MLNPSKDPMRRLAKILHGSQVDKSGRPYHHHPWRVADRVAAAGGTRDQVVAAYLHDVVEDTETTLDDLAESISAGALEVVDAMTHRVGETRAAYIARLMGTSRAFLVKLSDITDNLMPARMMGMCAELAPEERLRVMKRMLRKAGEALLIMSEMLDEEHIQ